MDTNSQIDLKFGFSFFFQEMDVALQLPRNLFQFSIKSCTVSLTPTPDIHPGFRHTRDMTVCITTRKGFKFDLFPPLTQPPFPTL